MKQKILNVLLFIPATIALILCRILVNIPRVKYWATDKILDLVKSKEEKELYLVYLSEMPHSGTVENLGNWRMAQIEHIEIKIKTLKKLFGINENDFIHMLMIERARD